MIISLLLTKEQRKKLDETPGISDGSLDYLGREKTNTNIFVTRSDGYRVASPEGGALLPTEFSVVTLKVEIGTKRSIEPLLKVLKAIDLFDLSDLGKFITKPEE